MIRPAVVSDRWQTAHTKAHPTGVACGHIHLAAHVSVLDCVCVVGALKWIFLFWLKKTHLSLAWEAVARTAALRHREHLFAEAVSVLAGG